MATNYNDVYVEIEGANGSREIMLGSRHLANRRIFLNGEINSEMADKFLKQMLYLKEMGDETVTIYVDSPGGEVNAGLMIYDIIQNADFPIDMVCTGLAASMGAVIMAGGQAGRRYILPHSNMMIHEPLISNGVGGSATSIKNISDSIIKTREMINGILSKHTGKTIEEIDKATSFDNHMNAEEAIEFGLCDKVTTLF